jgi:hypothetical protein
MRQTAAGESRLGAREVSLALAQSSSRSSHREVFAFPTLRDSRVVRLDSYPCEEELSLKLAMLGSMLIGSIGHSRNWPNVR